MLFNQLLSFLPCAGGEGQCALTVEPLPWRPPSARRRWQMLSCLFLFSKVLPKQATQLCSKKTQDGLSREDSMRDWEATELIKPKFPFLTCFALRFAGQWVGFCCSCGGRCFCGYLSAAITADTGGKPQLGEPNSNVALSTGEERIGLKLNPFTYYTV